MRPSCLVASWISRSSWIAVLLSTSMALAQTGPPPAPTYVSASDDAVFPAGGVGIGTPYGVVGGRLGAEIGYAGLAGGVGLVPFAWEPAFSLSASVYLVDRTQAVRPKLTGVYSNAVAVVAILDDGDPFDALYSKLYDGLAVYGGIDWRISKTSSICLDINVGAVFPTVGVDQVNEDHERIEEEFRSQGYVLREFSKARTFPFVSLGITLNPGRTLTRVLPGTR